MAVDKVSKMIFVGIVSKRNDAEGRVTVTRPDRDNQQSAELAVLQRGTHGTKEYWMPAIGDQVVCLHLPNEGGKGSGVGYVLGAVYSDKDKPAEQDADVRSTVFPDGSYVRYENGNIHIHAAGEVFISGKNIYLNE